MDTRSWIPSRCRPVAVVLGVLIGALLAAWFGVGAPDRPDPPRGPHPLWSDTPPVPEGLARGPTHVLEPELHSIRSEHGVHAGIMAF